MIPNIFVSSTIADLAYLRDGLRDAIDELCYHPVMSEHGEVGYLNPSTAAESCYRSVQQCHMIVLIVGRRYGMTGNDGLSVTHKEFLAAKEHHIPTITFVEPQVLSYRDVFHADRKATIWDSFNAMDNPRQTFQFLEEITSSEAFNAVIPFNSVGDAKRKLKLQIADFVGDRLTETVQPMSAQLKDVLAEMRTVRNLLVHSSATMQSKQDEAKRYQIVARQLLNDSALEYRSFLVTLFSDFDIAISAILGSTSFDDMLVRAGFQCELLADDMVHSEFLKAHSILEHEEERAISAHLGSRGGWFLYSGKRIRMSRDFHDRFTETQTSIYAKIKAI